MTFNERLSVSIYSWALTTDCRACICRCLYFLGRACCLLQSEENCRKLLIQHPEYSKTGPSQRQINTRKTFQVISAPQPAPLPESVLRAKPDGWSDRLWDIYQERHTSGNPDPIRELKKYKEKRSCWSWQWFPAGHKHKSSRVRQAYAFRDESELITYYQSEHLMGKFLELANLAVHCPMRNRTDEKMLTKSLLLCLYAARRINDTAGMQQIVALITQQNNKIDNENNKDYDNHDFHESLKAVNTWLKEVTCPMIHWPFDPASPWLPENQTQDRE